MNLFLTIELARLICFLTCHLNQGGTSWIVFEHAGKHIVKGSGMSVQFDICLTLSRLVNRFHISMAIRAETTLNKE